MDRVVVIGAGITGCFVAWFLAREGASVVLLDADGAGRQASGRNPGGLNPFHGPGIPGEGESLAWHSFETHWCNGEEIGRLAGTGPPIRRVERIELTFDEQERRSAREMMGLYEKRDGFSAEWLDTKALARLEPRLTSRATGGLLMRGNGEVDAKSYTLTVCAAARSLGVRYHRARVEDLKSTGNVAQSVVTDQGSHSASAVVLATGPWREQAEQWLGTTIPVKPVKGELLRVELPGEPLSRQVTHGRNGIYPLPGNQAWLGGTHEDAGYDASPSAGGKDAILRETVRLVPDVEKCRVLDQLGGLRPVTPDGLPVVGQVPGWENVYLATGAGSKGMLLGAGMGEAVARQVMGLPPMLDLSAMSPERFKVQRKPANGGVP